MDLWSVQLQCITVFAKRVWDMVGGSVTDQFEPSCCLTVLNQAIMQLRVFSNVKLSIVLSFTAVRKVAFVHLLLASLSNP